MGWGLLFYEWAYTPAAKWMGLPTQSLTATGIGLLIGGIVMNAAQLALGYAPRR